MRPTTTRGGRREGAGRKPVHTACNRCGAVCVSARDARIHCARLSSVLVVGKRQHEAEVARQTAARKAAAKLAKGAA